MSDYGRMQDRCAQLEAQNAELKAKLAAIKAERPEGDAGHKPAKSKTVAADA